MEYNLEKVGFDFLVSSEVEKMIGFVIFLN